MELAKITTKGQITIPVRIRKMLNLKDGDKVVFMPQGNTVVMENSTRLALCEAQEEFSGLKEELGLETEEDVSALCKQVRQEGLQSD
jgi:antitoxin PrlF